MVIIIFLFSGIRPIEIFPGLAGCLGKGGGWFADGVEGFYYSPGLPSSAYEIDILYSHTSLDFGTEYDFVGSSINRRIRIYLAGERIKTGDIPITQAGDTLPGSSYPEIIYLGTAEFKNQRIMLGFGYSFNKIGMGLVINYNEANLYRYYGRGVSFDMGAGFMAEKLLVSLSLHNLCPMGINWTNGFREWMDYRVNLSMGYKFLFSENMINGIYGGAGVDYLKGGKWYPHIGFVMVIGKYVKLTGGYDGLGINFGIGFTSRGVMLDYAYSTRREINGNHSFSVGWKR